MSSTLVVNINDDACLASRCAYSAVSGSPRLPINIHLEGFNRLLATCKHYCFTSWLLLGSSGFAASVTDDFDVSFVGTTQYGDNWTVFLDGIILFSHFGSMKLLC